MSAIAPPVAMSLTGAQVLTPSGLAEADLSVADGRIVAGLQARHVALPDHLVLPGIVDLHGDGFERHLAPRRGLLGDPAAGLLALDAELAAAGITTAVLAQFWSWEGGMRGPDFARRLAAALARMRPRLSVDLRLQLRLETHLLDDFAEVEDFVASAGIGYVVLNDHLPHRALAAGKAPPRLQGQALKGGRSPAVHLALMQGLHDRGAEVPVALDGLAAGLAARGVILGSHDDADPETRAAMRARGVRIAEFPETMAAAVAARAAGDPVLLGAPNVVRGGSHAGKMAAEAALAAGCCDALVSDYHYAALTAAALKLAAGPDGIAAAWDLISGAPSRIMGWHDRGRLVPGTRADVTVLAPDGRVALTLAGGRIAHACGAAAAALLAA